MSTATLQNVALETLRLFMKLKYVELADRLDKQLTSDHKDEFDENFIKEARTMLLTYVIPRQFHLGSEGSISLVEIHLFKRRHLIKHQCIPTFEELQAQNHLLSYPVQSDIPDFVFISHKWLKNGQCDSPDNQLWDALVSSGNGEDLIWLDKCCIPNDITWEEKKEFIRNLDQVVSESSRVETYTFSASDIMESGWCFVENVISGTPSFTVIGDGENVSREKWEDKAQLLKFTSVEDTPTVLIKSVDYVFAKGDPEVFKRVFATLECTIKTNYFNDFLTLYENLLGKQYTDKVMEMCKEFSDVWENRGNTYAHSQLRSRTAQERPISAYEAQAYQTLLRHPFASQYCPAKLSLVPFGIKPGTISWTTKDGKADAEQVNGFLNDGNLTSVFEVNLSRVFKVNTVSFFMLEAERNPYVVMRRTKFACMLGLFKDVTNFEEQFDKLFETPCTSENLVLLLQALSQTRCTQLQHLCQKRGALYVSHMTKQVVLPLCALDLTVKPLLVRRANLSDEDAMLRYPTTHGIRDDRGEWLSTMCWEDFLGVFGSVRNVEGVRLLTCIIFLSDVFKIATMDFLPDDSTDENPLFLTLAFVSMLRNPSEDTATKIDEKQNMILTAWKTVFKNKWQETLRFLFFYCIFGVFKEACESVNAYTADLFDKLEIPEAVDWVFGGKGMFGTRSRKAKKIIEVLRQRMKMIMEQHISNQAPRPPAGGFPGGDDVAMLLPFLLQFAARQAGSVNRE